jgi:deoxyadenosine/deoxycytidine kinase
MKKDDLRPLIGVVGPCGSGKSTLIWSLEKAGYRCRHVAQEHSYVKTMWQVITNPNILIYLKCSFENSTSRRKLNWLPADHEEQLNRLSHAFAHADLVIDTDSINAEAVLAVALEFLRKHVP